MVAIQYEAGKYRSGPDAAIAATLVSVRDGLIHGDTAAVRARCSAIPIDLLPLALGTIRATEHGEWKRCLLDLAAVFLDEPLNRRSKPKQLTLEEEVLRRAAGIMARTGDSRFTRCLDRLDVAGHAQALEHAAREGARTDGAGRPVVLVVAVAGALALEVVSLHGAGEALAAADRRDVDLRAGGDDVDGDLLADLVAVDGVDAELDEPLAGIDGDLAEVAGLGLVELLGVVVAVGDLEGAVAVAAS